MSDRVQIIFDRRCPFCRMMASLIADQLPVGWTLLSFEQYNKEHPEAPLLDDELSLVTPHELKRGEAAWLVLIEHIPSLKPYQKIAEKIGWTPKQQARWLRRWGFFLRRICRVCPHASPRFARRRLFVE